MAEQPGRSSAAKVKEEQPGEGGGGMADAIYVQADHPLGRQRQEARRT